MSDHEPKLSIQFRATIPNIQRALAFGGDAARITFEVPANEVKNAIALIALKGVGLKVTVEVDEQTISTGKTSEAGAEETDSESGSEADGGQAGEAKKTNHRRPWLDRSAQGGSAANRSAAKRSARRKAGKAD